ncbi:SGNH/GDSL hydrolase family protein [Roseivirga pacifica]|nr:SGNH/GDSL hydrolase family protein [Roseivirga pacifica]
MILLKTPDSILFDDEIIFKIKPYGEYLGVVMNDIGCIGPDWKGEKRDNEKRVLILGGSTSYSVDLPRITAENVNNKGSYSIVSCGKPRYTSYINRVNLEHNLMAYKPDIVVLYMGINDAIYNNFTWVDDKPEVGFFNWKSYTSWLSYDVLKYYLIDKGIRGNPEFATGALRSEEIFDQNVRAIIKTADQFGVEVILSDFAIAYPTTDKRLENKMLRMEPQMKHFWGNISSTRYAVERHNAIIKKLAEEYGLSLVSVFDKVPKNSEYFVDICHMTTKGKYVLANEIAKAIIIGAPVSKPLNPPLTKYP